MIPIEPIFSLPGFQHLVYRLQHGESLDNLGLLRSARLPIVAALHASLKRPLLLITDRSDRALALLDELNLWAPQTTCLYFPEPTSLFYEVAPWDETTRRSRLLVLTYLASQHIPALRQEGQVNQQAAIIVTTARAVMTRTLPRRDFIKATSILRPGQPAILDHLIRHWVSLGYEPVTVVTAPGQFARRGGILDVWPPADSNPARLDFFGDEVETIRNFDAATQRTIVDSPQRDVLFVTPAREYLVASLEEARRALAGSKEMAEWDESDLPPSETEARRALSEFHIAQLHPEAVGLLGYLPPEALVCIDDQVAFQDMIDEVEEQALSLRQDAIRSGAITADFPLPYLPWDEIQGWLERSQTLVLGPVTQRAPFEEDESEAENEVLMAQVAEMGSPLAAKQFKIIPLHDCFIPAPRFGGRIKPFFDHLVQVITQGDQVIVVSRQIARLKGLWASHAPSSLFALSIEEKPNAAELEQSVVPNPLFIQGSLAEGWVLTGLAQARRVHLLADGEIFGWQRPQPRRRQRQAVEDPEALYADLQPGDWVVHVDHGIGIFMGLVRRTIEGIENEYLAVEYANGDQLFVPIYQADRIARYVGVDGRMPTLDRLGSNEWRNTRARVKEGVQEVAEELLELYARRQIVSGYAFAADTPWQQELEASFPYIETEDQIKVLAEVKSDMEKPYPMDRLICGDVGYGKTEIALRAAFKAVMSGKQVAMLVPTTVLAQQHYQTFRERLAPFPVEVEMLSRFRTPQEQHDIVRRLAAGQVDIVIGTHRLLSADVQFKDLGLLIIDEEQRFGVTHKETLKHMRSEVDVLTLTATPIPRTLYMALTEIRDISTINTPPAERLPVVTYVGPYSPRLVRQAVLRELERGGQVFFVHNRVQTIEGMRRHLEKLIPEARIVVAHGQMNEVDLSLRMRAFNAGEIDVLLSTSIIESGLDIPNANTLIVDRADTFGLAQLYQLRGRIGRGAQRAYAYFFRHRKRLPTMEGRARLETIAEYTQLGSGFSIAMRDLEIRGAGDLLGTRQHGHIAAVGFHLYTRLLAEAVRSLQAKAGEKQPEAERKPLRFGLQQTILNQQSIDLPIPVSIPADYVPDKSARLRLYRRLADLHSIAEVEALGEEFSDRFGPPPEPVLNLLYQLKVKVMAEKTAVASIASENGLLAIRFPKLPEGMTQRAFPPLDKEVRVGKNTLWLPYKTQTDWKDRLISILEKLAEERQDGQSL